MLQVRDLPHQDNGCDCGLFALVYIEFFCYCTPRQIHLVPGANGDASPTLLKDFTGVRVPAAWGEDAVTEPRYLSSRSGEDWSAEIFGNFLTGRWFHRDNPWCLRFRLTTILVDSMLDEYKKRGRQVPNGIAGAVDELKRLCHRKLQSRGSVCATPPHLHVRALFAMRRYRQYRLHHRQRSRDV